MSSNQADDIPVLTEVIYPEHLHPSSPTTPDSAETAHQFSAEELLNLEQTVRENVLKQVLARIDFVLEHRVRDNLADVLQTAVEKLADEIRLGLKNSLEEVIQRALTQEIAKLKSNK